MAIPTVEDWLNVHDVSAHETTYLESALNMAILEVKSVIGEDAFSAVFASGTDAELDDSERDIDTTTTNEDAMRVSKVTYGCFAYAMYYLMQSVGLRFRPQGIVIRETDAGSPALSGSTNITNQYLTPTQLTEMMEMYKRQADNFLDAYRLKPDTPAYSAKRLLRG